MKSPNQPDELDNLFNVMPTSPDDQRKKRDKQLAMAAFNESQNADAHTREQNDNNRKGIFYSLRQTLITLISEGDKMTKRWVYSGAVAAVFLVAMSLTVVDIEQTELIPDIDGPVAIESESIKPPSESVELQSIGEEILVGQRREIATENSQSLSDDSRQQNIDVSDSDTLIAEKSPQVFGESAAASSLVSEPQFSSQSSSSQPFSPQSSKPQLSRTRESIAQDFAVTRPTPIIFPPGDGEGGQSEQSGQDDKFSSIEFNSVNKVTDAPISTFSIDVDTSAYSYVRSQLNSGILPKKNSVRLEELINYFDYQYPTPKSKDVPFESTITVMDSPWRKGNQLIHIGIKGYDIPKENIPRSNLVFLLDVSGSMNQANKLPLVKQSFELMLSQLHPEDTVAIVTYAGQSGVVLEPTKVAEASKILQAIKNLRATGSTAGAQGIQLAYELAESQYDKNAVNRIILATDGDFNVGVTDVEELKGLIERKRKTGVFLSVLGFGRGNYHDKLMQELAQNGNGVAAYIDTLSEAQKVLVEQSSALLFTIAKDVKIQVEFNPATVAEYRLLGYETRALSTQDFNNDKVDAGEIGSGHTVTAIYDITPVGSSSGLYPNTRYGETEQDSQQVSETKTNEYGYLKIRYKLPESSQSELIETPILSNVEPNNSELNEAHFSVSVAGFAQLLTGGTYLTEYDYDDVINLAQAHKGIDAFGYRSEFIQLVRKAKIAKDLN